MGLVVDRAHGVAMLAFVRTMDSGSSTSESSSCSFSASPPDLDEKDGAGESPDCLSGERIGEE